MKQEENEHQVSFKEFKEIFHIFYVWTVHEQLWSFCFIELLSNFNEINPNRFK